MRPTDPEWKTVLASAAFLIACSIALIVMFDGWVRWFGVLGVVLWLAALCAYVLKWRREAASADWTPIIAAEVAPGTDRAAYVPQPLSGEDRQELAHLLTVLYDAGIIAPDKPETEMLVEAVSDVGGDQVDAETVLAALQEAVYYHEDFDAARYLANLRFHAEQVEQFADTIAEQLSDLAALAGAPPLLTLTHVQCTALAEGTGKVQLMLQARVGASELAVETPVFSKYLNFALFVRMARALQQAQAPRRVAWWVSDVGVWFTGLAADTDLRALNHALNCREAQGWQWIDAQEDDL